MNIFYWILFISMLSTVNAQWFIKKNDLSKLMNYPNPGKRSLSEKQSTFVKTDCSIPYSQLHLYRQKIAWIFACGYKKSSLRTNHNSLSSDANRFEVDLPTTAKLRLHEKRSLHVVPPYFKEDDISSNRLIMRFQRRMGIKK